MRTVLVCLIVVAFLIDCIVIARAIEAEDPTGMWLGGLGIAMVTLALITMLADDAR